MIRYTLCVYYYDDEFEVIICKDLVGAALPREGEIVVVLGTLGLMVDQVRHYCLPEKSNIEVRLMLDDIADEPGREASEDVEPLALIHKLWNDGSWSLHENYIDDEEVHRRLVGVVHS